MMSGRRAAGDARRACLFACAVAIPGMVRLGWALSPADMAPTANVVSSSSTGSPVAAGNSSAGIDAPGASSSPPAGPNLSASASGGGSPAVPPLDSKSWIPQQIEGVRPATQSSFYGWQILVVGGASGLVTAASLVLPEKPFDSFLSVAGFVIGVPTYGLAGPIFHWSHGQFEKGLLSFGLNVASPLLGLAIGPQVSCGANDSSDCADKGQVAGAAVGFLVAPVLDGLLLGWEEVPVDYIGRTPMQPASHRMAGRFQPRGLPAGFTLTPYMAVRPEGRTDLGVWGRF